MSKGASARRERRSAPASSPASTAASTAADSATASRYASKSALVANSGGTEAAASSSSFSIGGGFTYRTIPRSSIDSSPTSLGRQYARKSAVRNARVNAGVRRTTASSSPSSPSSRRTARHASTTRAGATVESSSETSDAFDAPPRLRSVAEKTPGGPGRSLFAAADSCAGVNSRSRPSRVRDRFVVVAVDVAAVVTVHEQSALPQLAQCGVRVRDLAELASQRPRSRPRHLPSRQTNRERLRGG